MRVVVQWLALLVEVIEGSQENKILDTLGPLVIELRGLAVESIWCIN